MPISVRRATSWERRSSPVENTEESRRPLLRILFLHQDVTKVERCMQELRGVQVAASGDVVFTAEEFGERLRSQTYDLVLAEYPNSICPGAETIQLLRGTPTKKQIPVIFLVDMMRRETAAELITQGAADCIDLEHLGHLPVGIRRALDENKLREERDLAEQQLRHSVAHYRALVGNLTYGMCRCDLDGNFLDVNQALVTMLGYSSKEELLSKNLAREILGDPRMREHWLGDSGQGEQPDPVETDWNRKDGTILKVRLSGREVKTEDGERHGYELIVEDVTKQRELEDHLRQQAAKDPLTGLANYRHLVNVLDSEIKRSSRTGREFALLLFDVDGLKQINDNHGHVTGSQALCRVADVLCIFSREIDTAARFGGDEFALVLPETGQEPAQHVAQRIRDRLANDGQEPKISVSAGLAVYPGDAERIDTLLSVADVAMYSMKGRAHRFHAVRQGQREEETDRSGNAAGRSAAIISRGGA
jgi:diguanylate cyclase (GGDEF)-like protein/PAS domain S-box-containing protein